MRAFVSRATCILFRLLAFDSGLYLALAMVCRWSVVERQQGAGEGGSMMTTAVGRALLVWEGSEVGDDKRARTDRPSGCVLRARTVPS